MPDSVEDIIKKMGESKQAEASGIEGPSPAVKSIMTEHGVSEAEAQDLMNTYAQRMYIKYPGSHEHGFFMRAIGEFNRFFAPIPGLANAGVQALKGNPEGAKMSLSMSKDALLSPFFSGKSLDLAPVSGFADVLQEAGLPGRLAVLPGLALDTWFDPVGRTKLFGLTPKGSEILKKSGRGGLAAVVTKGVREVDQMSMPGVKLSVKGTQSFDSLNAIVKDTPNDRSIRPLMGMEVNPLKAQSMAGERALFQFNWGLNPFKAKKKSTFVSSSLPGFKQVEPMIYGKVQEGLDFMYRHFPSFFRKPPNDYIYHSLEQGRMRAQEDLHKEYKLRGDPGPLISSMLEDDIFQTTKEFREKLKPLIPDEAERFKVAEEFANLKVFSEEEEAEKLDTELRSLLQTIETGGGKSAQAKKRLREVKKILDEAKAKYGSALSKRDMHGVDRSALEIDSLVQEAADLENKVLDATFPGARQSYDVTDPRVANWIARKQKLNRNPHVQTLIQEEIKPTAEEVAHGLGPRRRNYLVFPVSGEKKLLLDQRTSETEIFIQTEPSKDTIDALHAITYDMDPGGKFAELRDMGLEIKESIVTDASLRIPDELKKIPLHKLTLNDLLTIPSVEKKHDLSLIEAQEVLTKWSKQTIQYRRGLKKFFVWRGGSIGHPQAHVSFTPFVAQNTFAHIRGEQDGITNVTHLGPNKPSTPFQVGKKVTQTSSTGTDYHAYLVDLDDVLFDVTSFAEQQGRQKSNLTKPSNITAMSIWEDEAILDSTIWPHPAKWEELTKEQKRLVHNEVLREGSKGRGDKGFILNRMAKDLRRNSLEEYRRYAIQRLKLETGGKLAKTVRAGEELISQKTRGLYRRLAMAFKGVDPSVSWGTAIDAARRTLNGYDPVRALIASQYQRMIDRLGQLERVHGGKVSPLMMAERGLTMENFGAYYWKHMATPEAITIMRENAPYAKRLEYSLNEFYARHGSMKQRMDDYQGLTAIEAEDFILSRNPELKLLLEKKSKELGKKVSFFERNPNVTFFARMAESQKVLSASHAAESLVPYLETLTPDHLKAGYIPLSQLLDEGFNLQSLRRMPFHTDGRTAYQAIEDEANKTFSLWEEAGTKPVASFDGRPTIAKMLNGTPQEKHSALQLLSDTAFKLRSDGKILTTNLLNDPFAYGVAPDVADMYRLAIKKLKDETTPGIILGALETMIQAIGGIGTGKINIGKILGGYRGLYKMASTVMWVPHHIFNVVGDTLMSIVGGAVKDPLIYNRAWKMFKRYLKDENVVLNLPGFQGTIRELVDHLSNSGVLGSGTFNVAELGAAIKKGGIAGAEPMFENKPGPILKKLGDITGLGKLGAIKLPQKLAKGRFGLFFGDTIGSTTRTALREFGPFAASVAITGTPFVPVLGPRSGKTLALARETIWKFAHVLGMLEQGYPLIQAIDSAKTWLFNYADKSLFDKVLGRRVIPFWGWVRNNTPLMFKLIAQKPGTVTYTNSVIRAIEEATDPNSSPMDRSILPEWLKNRLMMGAISEGELVTAASTGLPFDDFAQMAGNPIGQVFQRFDPIIQMAMNSFAGKDLVTGVPISENERAHPMIQYLPEAFKDLIGFRPLVDAAGTPTGYRANPKWNMILNTITSPASRYGLTLERFHPKHLPRNEYVEPWRSWFGVSIRTYSPEHLSALYLGQVRRYLQDRIDLLDAKYGVASPSGKFDKKFIALGDGVLKDKSDVLKEFAELRADLSKVDVSLFRLGLKVNKVNWEKMLREKPREAAILAEQFGIRPKG